MRQRLGRNVKGRQRKQMGPLSQIITHASGPGLCECWQRWDILQWLFVVNLKLSVTHWWPVLPLCATGQLMCRLMSCFTVPTVWHQHTFFISVNCSYLISDRDVNIHLRWSDHSWSAKIDCHLHLVVVRISNVSPLTTRDHILTNGGSYFRSQILPFKSLGSLKKLLLFGKDSSH